MTVSNISVLLGAVGTFLVSLWAVIHGVNSDKRQADNDRQKLDAYILDTVKKDNQQLRDDREADRKKFADDLASLGEKLADLSAKKDAMEQELNQQIALKVSENEALRKRNAALERENQAYRERFGKL